jgi:hypothetical protein
MPASGELDGMESSSQATEAMQAIIRQDSNGRASPTAARLAAVPNGSLALYRPANLLGEGTFGYVVQAINRATGQEVAIKFVECG